MGSVARSFVSPSPGTARQNPEHNQPGYCLPEFRRLLAPTARAITAVASPMHMYFVSSLPAVAPFKSNKAQKNPKRPGRVGP